MWFAQEQVKMGNIKVKFISGKQNPADKLTKVTPVKEFELFRDIVMGTFLLMDENDNEVTDPPNGDI
jgi:hypothetical protein